jgi:hypothetical protein
MPEIISPRKGEQLEFASQSDVMLLVPSRPLQDHFTANQRITAQ